MLDSLRIKNIAVIENTQIEFSNGLNILSGETGAGKSIVIEAIALLLGDRANQDLIRNECDEATIEAYFDISHLPVIQNRLTQMGFEKKKSSSELLIKRVVQKNGPKNIKNRIHVNGESITLSMLSELTEGLIDLCSQHEHQSLTKSQTQLTLLDRYASLDAERETYTQFYREWKKITTELDELTRSEAEHLKQIDYLKFQLNEIEESKLTESDLGLDEKLHQEKQLLQSAQARAGYSNQIQEIFENEETGVLELYKKAASKLKTLAQWDADQEKNLTELDKLISQTENFSDLMNQYASSIEIDEEKLVGIQDQLVLLGDLKRKYGGTLESVLKAKQTLKQELDRLENNETNRAALIKAKEDVEKKLIKHALKISETRKKFAKLFSDSVTGELKDLRMSGAKFIVQVQPIEELKDYRESGRDQIEFLVQTNPGEEAKPLGRIASGGELSRILLAIRRTISDQGGIGVYLFDEIDAGIGGQTAFEVGKKLKSVSKHNQVICITHLPQVAAFADHHWNVEKTTTKGRTKTEVVKLNASDRKEEIARMLGGPTLTKKNLENAQELLSLAK